MEKKIEPIKRSVILSLLMFVCALNANAQNLDAYVQQTNEFCKLFKIREMFKIGLATADISSSFSITPENEAKLLNETCDKCMSIIAREIAEQSRKKRFTLGDWNDVNRLMRGPAGRAMTKVALAGAGVTDPNIIGKGVTDADNMEIAKVADTPEMEKVLVLMDIVQEVMPQIMEDSELMAEIVALIQKYTN